MKTATFFKPVILSLFLLLHFSACQELYDPQLEIDKQYLVVQGLLTTDAPGMVILSTASVFGHTRHRTSVWDATVHIETGQGEMIRLTGFHQDGIYYTPYDFKGEVGETYVLHVETRDGFIYQSKPQTIQPPIQVASMDAATGKDYQYFPSSVSDRLFQREIEGTHVYIEPEMTVGNGLKYRFTTNLYLQYTISVDGGMGPPAIDYCWEKREVTNLVRRDVSHEETSRLRTAFIPRYGHQMHHFNFPRLDYQSHRMAVLRLFSLNSDSYAYYSARYKQLSDAGKIFDPIAAQIPGNMYCVNDENQLVFGLFETSSVQQETFRLIVNYATGEATILPRYLDDPIPVQGCLREETPPFWL